MTAAATVDTLGERALIERMAARVPHAASPVGPGDDAAVLAPFGGARVLTTDAMIEGVHFLRAHPPRWLGWKLLAANLSDVSAMGARPEGFTVTAALPPDLPVRWWALLADGLGDLARESGSEIAGGDVVRTDGPVSLSVTAWGRLDGEEALLRTGGRPGDLVMVRGPIGRAGVGLARWLARDHGDARALETPEETDAAVRWHLRPEPPLDAGPFALAHGARAGMDLSDGLAADGARLGVASGVRVVVDLDRLPPDPACGGSTADQRVSGGEDYGLLVLVPPGRREAFRGRGFSVVGRAEDGPPGVAWRREGREVDLEGASFEHFSTG
ncbi:MAG: thiamine-phosphate kinase [Myxococcota bacterium]